LKVIWAILCQSAAIDKDSNNVSLFNVLEEVHVAAELPQEPSPGMEMSGLAPLPSELVTLWERTDPDVPEHGYGRIKLILPNGKSWQAGTHEVDLTRFIRLRSRGSIPGIPIGGEGVYRFVIEGKGEDGEWVQMFELPLQVVVQRQEHIPNPPPISRASGHGAELA
jgi:hypothetical protein